MMPRMTHKPPPTPTTIDRLLSAIADQLSTAAAREVADLRSPDDVLARLDLLAEKTTSGEELDPAERAEYDGILQIAHVVTLIQSRLDLPPEVDATPRIGAAPISRTPRTVGAGRDLSKLAGLRAMLDDLDPS